MKVLNFLRNLILLLEFKPNVDSIPWACDFYIIVKISIKFTCHTYGRRCRIHP